MEERLIERYRLELEYLRQLGLEFASGYPQVAGQLGLTLQGMDPHVERLRESFALLTARVRAKIEDQFPELTEAMLGILYPQSMEPLPSMSVVRFEVSDDQAIALTRGPEVEAGSVLKSGGSGRDPDCEFRTGYPVTLWPLRVDPASLSRHVEPGSAPGASAVLTVPIRCLGPVRLVQLDLKFDSLRMFLDGEGRSPFALRDLLLNDVIRIEAVESPARPGAAPLTLASNRAGVRRMIRPVGFGRAEGLLPHPPLAPVGYRNIREYHAFPQKFLFVDVKGIGAVRRWAAPGFELKFYLGEAPGPEMVIRRESVQIHCAPIVNLFGRKCKVDRDETRLEYPVEIPESRDPDHVDFFEVASVDSVRSGTRGYRRFDDLRPRPLDAGRSYWVARRRPSNRRGSKRTHLTLSFVDEGCDPGPPTDSTLTVEVTCTNLDLPARLPIESLKLQRAAPVSGVVPLVRMTEAHPPPTANEAHWRLISHLALGRLPLGDPPPPPGNPRAAGRGTEALREILRLHDPAREGPTRRGAEAIRHVESAREFRPLPGDPRSVVSGVRITVDFGEEVFAATGMLLPEVLEQFLGHHVSVNAFSRLVANVGRGKVKQWEPRAGETTLI